MISVSHNWEGERTLIIFEPKDSQPGFSKADSSLEEALGGPI